MTESEEVYTRCVVRVRNPYLFIFYSPIIELNVSGAEVRLAGTLRRAAEKKAQEIMTKSTFCLQHFNDDGHLVDAAPEEE